MRPSTRTSARRAVACLAAAVAVTGSALAAPSLAAASARITPACTGHVLVGTVETPQAGAGQRYSRLVVTNTGSGPCVLFGYSGLLLLDAHGRALPTRTRRAAAPVPRLFALAPGQRAAENLHWGVVPGQGEPTTSQCQPTPVYLLVHPWSRLTPFLTGWRHGPVCQFGLIDISAYYRI